MKKWFKYFVYISLLFLIIALWQADFFIVPTIESYGYLALSLLFLAGGFLTKSWVWVKTLNQHPNNISFWQGYISVGLAEMGKYIPGKLWLLLGRAGYIAEQYQIPLKDTSYSSVVTQILTLWSGLIIGAIGFFFVTVPIEWILLYFAGLFLMTLFLFIPSLHNKMLGLLNRIFKKKISLPVLSFGQVTQLLPAFFFDWIIRITGFGLLLLALNPASFSWEMLPGYPISVTLGIMAVIAPGGLGVREGVLAFWLHASGLDINTATTYSLVIRLWMLVGELSVFFIALLLKKKHKSQ
jgi:hypothetical protein